MKWDCFDDVITSIRDATSADALRAAMDQASRRMGFSYWSLVQKSESDLGFDHIQHTNYPREWLEMLARDYFYLHDPVLQAVDDAACEFWWDELPTLIPMTGRQRAFMTMAAQMGVADGLTVPIHVRREPSGLCSFALEAGRTRPSSVEPLAHWIAHRAMRQARKIRSLTHARSIGLSETERDVIRMTAQGMRPGTIATLLEMDRSSVRQTLREVQRRQCARSPMQLVVNAYRLGDLTARDLLM